MQLPSNVFICSCTSTKYEKKNIQAQKKYFSLENKHHNLIFFLAEKFYYKSHIYFLLNFFSHSFRTTLIIQRAFHKYCDLALYPSNGISHGVLFAEMKIMRSSSRENMPGNIKKKIRTNQPPLSQYHTFKYLMNFKCIFISFSLLT